MEFARFIGVTTLVFTSFLCQADDFGQRLDEQSLRAQSYMRANVSRNDGALGSVVAAPSKNDPDYYYHWTRDAALTMDALHTWQLKSTDQNESRSLLNSLKDYVTFSRFTQTTGTPSNSLGEPRFYLDGTGFFGPWGRPQNDGPALRAITLVRLAKHLLQVGEKDYVKNYLYAPSLPAYTVVKADLEYVAHHWQDTSYDVWEEVRGDHFYNRMVQRRALLDGANLADTMDDPGAAGYYRQQAAGIANTLGGFFDAKKSYVGATQNRDEGVDYKYSNLDSVTVLGVLHGMPTDGLFGPADDRVIATVQSLIKAFHDLYSINQKTLPGVAIGRYPEDRYDGINVGTAGNPWFLATHGLAEIHYKMALAFQTQGYIKVTKLNLPFLKSLKSNIQSTVGKTLKSDQTEFNQIIGQLLANGDQFLERTLFHMDQKTGSMSEQINRNDGYLRGAHDLTWSYASFLTAYWARQQLVDALKSTSNSH